MDKLNAPNPTAVDLGQVFGMTEQRMNEISTGLDDMVEKATTGKIRLVYTIEIINYIRSLCNTEEEFVWAYHNHIIWLAKTGRLFTTKEAQSGAMSKYGNPQNL